MKVAFDTNVILDFILHRPMRRLLWNWFGKLLPKRSGESFPQTALRIFITSLERLSAMRRLVRRSLTFWLSLTWHPLMVMVAVRRWQPP